jgi:hypothetical protein
MRLSRLARFIPTNKVLSLAMAPICLVAGLLAGSQALQAVQASSASASSSACNSYAVLLAHADGAVSMETPSGTSCANPTFLGSLAGKQLNAPIVGMATVPGGGGYWLVAADGGIFTFGDAKYFGSTGNLKLNAPIVGMASTPDGGGYWLTASDGGVFTFGDATYQGSTGNLRLNKPVVGIATDGATGGYWLVASDGGVFGFNAPYLGALAGTALNAPIRFITGTPDFAGYRMVGADGGVFNFGDAQYFGSASNTSGNTWQALAPSPDGGGYWLFSNSTGGTAVTIAPYGDASSTLNLDAGDLSASPIVGAATTSTTALTVGSQGGVVPSSANGFFTSISCATTSDCVAVGGTADSLALIETSVNGGSSFTAVPVPPTAPFLVSVDCNDATHCVAVGRSSAMVSNNGGANWTLDSTPLTQGTGETMASVACESDTLCTAVGTPAANGSYIYSTDGGVTWHSSNALGGDPAMGSLTCFGTTCMAIGEGGARSTDGGMTWSAIATGSDNSTSLACIPGGSTCLAVGPNPVGVTQPTAVGFLQISLDGGQTWTIKNSNLPASTASIQTVSCAGTTDCVVVGPSPNGTSGTLVILNSANSGSTWVSYAGPTGYEYYPSSVGSFIPWPSVSCSSATECVIAGAGTSGPIASVTGNGGKTWTNGSVQ